MIGKLILMAVKKFWSCTYLLRKYTHVSIERLENPKEAHQNHKGHEYSNHVSKIQSKTF